MLLNTIKPQQIKKALQGISTTNSTAEVYTETNLMTPNTIVKNNASQALTQLNSFRNDPNFAGIDGKGFSIAILDTGIDLNHPFFGADNNKNGIADRIVYQQDFANNDNDASDKMGHGSNVASIAASSNTTYQGVAPGANIIPLKVFTDAGIGSFTYIEKALQWVVANASKYNIASVNMSLGDSGNHNVSKRLYGIDDELQALKNLNVTVVSASGNRYGDFKTQGVAYPSASPNSLSVGAVYNSSAGAFNYGSARAYSTTPDQITPFSQRSQTLTTIFAPGAPITGANQNGGTTTMQGTSQATPFISGVVALAQQLAMEKLGRRLTVNEFTNLLKSTGTSIKDGDDENDNVVNTNLQFKLVNVKALGQAISSMATPSVITDSNTNVNYLLTTNATSVAEKNLGSQTISFNLKRSDNIADPSFLSYSFSGTATNNVDYKLQSISGNGITTTTSNTIKFAAGATSAVINVAVLGDVKEEPNETIALNLSTTSKNDIISGVPAKVNIIDDEPLSRPKLSIVSDVSLTEGNLGLKQANFIVKLSSSSTKKITVSAYTLNGSAISGSDYITKKGTLTFNPGQTSQTFSVSIKGDTKIETKETFSVRLTNATNATTDETIRYGSIINDDTQQLSNKASKSSIQSNDIDVITGEQQKFVYEPKDNTIFHIKDFHSGDQIILNKLFESIGYQGLDPQKDSYLKLIPQGSNTNIEIDRDGLGKAHHFKPIIVVEGVDSTSLNHPANFVF